MKYRVGTKRMNTSRLRAPERDNMKLSVKNTISCLRCERPLVPEWVACPHCGEPRTSEGRRRDIAKPEIQSRFICPGCGEKAIAGNGHRYCSDCKAFVHFGCMVDRGLLPRTCPICDTPLY